LRAGFRWGPFDEKAFYLWQLIYELVRRATCDMQKPDRAWFSTKVDACNQSLAAAVREEKMVKARQASAALRGADHTRPMRTEALHTVLSDC